MSEEIAKENQDSFDPVDAFEEVEGSYTPNANRRKDTSGTVEHTGLTKLNMNPSDEVRKLAAEQNLDLSLLRARFRTNAITRVVAAELVPPNTPNSQPVRQNKDRTFTFYLHPVFAKHPGLRPSGKIEIQVSRGVVKGKQCLLIDLNGLATRSSTRKGGENAASS